MRKATTPCRRWIALFVACCCLRVRSECSREERGLFVNRELDARIRNVLSSEADSSEGAWDSIRRSDDRVVLTLRGVTHSSLTQDLFWSSIRREQPVRPPQFAATASEFSWRTVALSRSGGTHPLNQDNFVIQVYGQYEDEIDAPRFMRSRRRKNRTRSVPDIALAGVFDGHGENGELVSAACSQLVPTLFETLRLHNRGDLSFWAGELAQSSEPGAMFGTDAYLENPQDAPHRLHNLLDAVVRRRLQELFEAVNHYVVTRDAPWTGGSTMTLTMWDAVLESLWVANAGDSPAFLIDDNRKRFVQLTAEGDNSDVDTLSRIKKGLTEWFGQQPQRRSAPEGAISLFWHHYPGQTSGEQLDDDETSTSEEDSAEDSRKSTSQNSNTLIAEVMPHLYEDVTVASDGAIERASTTALADKPSVPQGSSASFVESLSTAVGKGGPLSSFRHSHAPIPFSDLRLPMFKGRRLKPRSRQATAEISITNVCKKAYVPIGRVGHLAPARGIGDTVDDDVTGNSFIRSDPYIRHFNTSDWGSPSALLITSDGFSNPLRTLVAMNVWEKQVKDCNWAMQKCLADPAQLLEEWAASNEDWSPAWEAAHRAFEEEVTNQFEQEAYRLWKQAEAHARKAGSEIGQGDWETYQANSLRLQLAYMYQSVREVDKENSRLNTVEWRDDVTFVYVELKDKVRRSLVHTASAAGERTASPPFTDDTAGLILHQPH